MSDGKGSTGLVSSAPNVFFFCHVATAKWGVTAVGSSWQLKSTGFVGRIVDFAKNLEKGGTWCFTTGNEKKG
jgi:hypothetical protein